MNKAVERGEAAAGQQQPQSPSEPIKNNDAPQRGRHRKVAQKVLGWGTGYTPTKMAIRELVDITRGAGWILSQLKQGLLSRVDESKEDKKLADRDPEQFWDEMVISAKITSGSLRSRYRLAYWMDYFVLGVFALSVGFTVANGGLNSNTIISITLCNLVLISHISQIHKMYIAREQRIITIGKLIALIARNPIMLFPEPLPANYALRQPKNISVNEAN